MITSNKSLSVEYPLITMYQDIASLFSVLCANKEKTMKWICDHCIQLTVAPYGIRWNFYDFGTPYNIYSVSYCPFIDFYRLNKMAVNDYFSNFTDFIEYQINNGYYIRVHMDQFYLSCSNRYKANHNMHEVFIYGYDRDKKEIMVADFIFGKPTYFFTTVMYDELNLSFSNSMPQSNDPIWFSDIKMFKYVDYDYKINMDLLKVSLNDYLNCTDNMLIYKYCFRPENADLHYGLNYYDELAEYCVAGERRLDRKAFHLLCEHKIIMSMRLEYLKDNNYINAIGYKQVFDKCKKNEIDTLGLRNMALKYNTTNNEDLLKRMSEKCYELKKQDSEFVSDLISILK